MSAKRGKSVLSFFPPTFVRYCIIGVINTLACFGVIFMLMYGFGINYMLSNAVGYAVGITVSFILNKFRNFRSEGTVRTELPLFIAAFGLSYAANILILWLLGTVLHTDVFFAQLAGGTVYTMTFYLFMKSVVFTKMQCRS